MDDTNLLFTMFLQVFSQQASVALFWGVFATKETCTVICLCAIFLCYFSVLKYFSVDFHVFFPSHFMLVPLVEQLFGGRKINNVFIRNVANLFGEKLQIFALGKASQLTTIADTNINELFHIVVA